jgi:serine/threonine protein kinase
MGLVMPATHSIRAHARRRLNDRGELILGRYRLIRPLGRGGMGAVFLAADEEAGGRLLAVKRVRRASLHVKSLLDLRREFLSLAALSHPGLARAHNLLIDERGGCFFTCEYVEGIDWLQAARRLDLSSPSGLEILLDLAAQVLRALAFIHARGLVHGDLKPAHVLIREERRVPGHPRRLQAKLIDIGAAAAAQEPDAAVGTLYYVAPETIRGAPMDARTDLYSLGVVLHQLLSGSPPFRGATSLELLKAHLETPPARLADKAPHLPRELDPILGRLMAKEPADRFSGALEVIEEINLSMGLSFPLETPETLESYLSSSSGGREPEMERLEATLEAVFGVLGSPRAAPAPERGGALPAGSSGVERFLLLRGEAGMGKRRLAEILRRGVLARGGVFLEIEASGSREERGGGVARLVRELERLEKGRRRRIEPEYVHRARRLAAEVRGSRVRLDDSHRLGLVEIALGLFDASRERPLVLHLHDLHLASRGLLELAKLIVAVGAAGGQPPDSRLLLSGTFEGNAAHEHLPLLEAAELRRATIEVELGPLDLARVRCLLRSALPGSELPERFEKWLLEESGGKPSEVVQLLELLLRNEIIRRTPAGWTLGGARETEAPAAASSEERQAGLPQSGTSASASPTGDLGLIGRSPPMRELFRSLRELPPGAPWVWILGPEGSGKREVGRAIHRRAQEEGSAILVEESAERLDECWIAGLFDEIESERKAGGARLPVILVLKGAEELEGRLQSLLLEAARRDGALTVAALARREPQEAPPRLCAELSPPPPVLRVPPLAARPGDIDLLFRFFQLLLAGPAGEGSPALDGAALEVLESHPWPRNVRELLEVTARLQAASAGRREIDAELARRALRAASHESGAPHASGTAGPRT